MNSIYNLLKINHDIIRDFPLLAESLDDYQTEKTINKQIKRLKEIEDRMSVGKIIEFSRQSVDQVITKVRKFSAKEDLSLGNWSIRELRMISYNLLKLQGNEKDFLYALSLLDIGWKNMFFNGLLFFLTNSWNVIKPIFRKETYTLLEKKLKDYNQDIKKYKLLKNNINLFEKNGPLRMAAILSSKNIKLTDAPTVIGCKSITFGYSYYSDVIIKSVKDNDITDIGEIEEILEQHNLDRTKKLLFLHLVEIEDEFGDAVSRMKLCRAITRNLSDVTLASTWAPFIGATEQEAQKLKWAKEQVNLWFAQQIIEVFFEVCVQDKARKKFWLKYVKYLTGFRIIGATSVKRLLQNNSRIGSLVFRHFTETNSLTSQTSALALFFKNKMIVEFSDVGAMYVYNHDHKQVKLVMNKRLNMINSTNDLKIPSMQNLIEQNSYTLDFVGVRSTYYSFYEEGKVFHRGAWQDRMESWMDKMIVRTHSNSPSFFNTSDDDLFKAKPIAGNESEIEEDFYERNQSKQTTETTFSKDSKSANTPSQKHSSSNKVNEVVSPITQKTHVEENKELPLYEINVVPRIQSKWENGVQFVANKSGYYIHTYSSHKFAKVKNFDVTGQPIIGFLLVKKQKQSEWSEITHFFNGREICIGYFIKRSEKEIIFKASLSDEKHMNIKL